MSDSSIARPRFLIVALALSVVLNACMLGGFSYALWMGPHMPPPAPGHRLDALPRQLHLTAEQKPAYEEFRRTLRVEQEALAERDRPTMVTAWDELRNDKPDVVKVQAALDEMAQHRHDFQVAATAATIKFMAALTPEQREIMERSSLDHHGPADALLHNVGK